MLGECSTVYQTIPDGGAEMSDSGDGEGSESAGGAEPGQTASPVLTRADVLHALGPTLWMASILYFAAQIFVGWIWNPPYSVINNTIRAHRTFDCAVVGVSV